MQQKGEMEKRLLHATPQESPSTDSSILLKHLQEELRNYVSRILICYDLNVFSLLTNSKSLENAEELMRQILGT